MQRIFCQQYIKYTLCKTDCFEKMSNCTVRKDCECTATDVKLTVKSYNSPRQQCKRRWKHLYVPVYVLICSEARYGILYNTLHGPRSGMQCNSSYGETYYMLYLFFYFDGG